MKLNFKAAIQDRDASSRDRLSAHRILLVDDEAPNLLSLARRLSEDYEVVTFTSAIEALNLIDSNGPDSDFSVIISDQIMPEMNGVEFLTELHKRQHPAPRFILTGYAALENVVSAVNQAAIFRYLSKPVDVEKMQQAIKEAIALVEMRQENGRLLTMVKGLLEKTAELQKHQVQQPTGVSGFAMQGFTPRRHEVVVVFADIRGFTRASKGANPELVIQSLDRIFQPLHEIIYSAGGVVDKHLGDGLMAIFGLVGGNSAHAALTATRQMADRASIILTQLEKPMHDLKISLGVAAGSVILGIMGSSHRSELAVIGETANFASRLQEFSKQALHPNGLETFGPFDRSIALCSPNMLGLNDAFVATQLDGQFAIRDFSEVASIGIYNPTRKNSK